MNLFFDPNSLDNRRPAALEAVAPVVDRFGRYYHRFEAAGLERIPEGPALYVGNHNGGLLTIDTFLAFARVCVERGPSDVPYPLVHSVVLRLPVINQILGPLGGVEATRHNAFRLLDAGHKVLVYPGGDVEAFRPFRERHRVKFAHRHGYLEIAIEQGVPLVPVVAAGAHATFVVLDDLPWLAEKLHADTWLRSEVWPLTFSIPWGLTVGPPPPHLPFPVKIAVEFLEPIEFERTGWEAATDEAYVTACADRVEARMQSALDRLVAQKL